MSFTKTHQDQTVELTSPVGTVCVQARPCLESAHTFKFYIVKKKDNSAFNLNLRGTALLPLAVFLKAPILSSFDCEKRIKSAFNLNLGLCLLPSLRRYTRDTLEARLGIESFYMVIQP